MTTLKLYLLGAPRLELAGQLVATDTRKAVALLAYLMLNQERASRDWLAAFLWPDYDDSRAKAALRRTLSTLKTAIGGEFIHATRDVIGLETEHIWCDVLVYKQNLTDGELETAVALYRDDFMTGFSLRDSIPFDDWQLLHSQNLRRELETALENLINQTIVQQNYTQALPLTHRWLALDPLREEVHRLLMQLYAWLGQPNAALRQYRACVRILEEELGVPPLSETTALYEAIQNNRLAAPHPTAKAEAVLLPITAQASASPTLLFGRASELALMQATYQQVGQQTGSNGRFLAIEGETGIGKTRLAEAFLSQLPEANKLLARCFAGENHLAYAPIVQALRDALRQPQVIKRAATVPEIWLAEAARLLPELVDYFPNLPAPPPLEWPGAPGRLLEGISQLLAAYLSGSEPGVLWLDDAQWADDSTLDLLAFLTHRWRKRPYLILICWHEANLPANSRLHQLLAERRRDGSGALLTLTRLAAADVQQWVTAVVPDSDLGERLYQETEGLPFLIKAYLDTFPGSSNAATQWHLPTTVRDLFHSHLARAGETGRQLLQAASVFGRPFDFDLLLAAGGRSDEETVLAVEMLLTQNLLVEQRDALTYDFAHHKLREMVYAEMTLIRQRLLHKRTATTLANLRTVQPGAMAAITAHHYQLAGLEAEAALYFRQAGDYARLLFAHREALTHYQSALALGNEETAVLHEACGDLRTRLGAYVHALNSYERAAAVGSGDNLPRIEHKIGQVHVRRGEFGLAERHFAQADASWQSAADVTSLARLRIDWATTAYRAGDLHKANELAEQAKALLSTQPTPDPLAAAQAANLLGMLAQQRGELAAAIDHYAYGLQLAETHQLLAAQITVLNNLALAETAVNQFDTAQQHLETALNHCLVYGDRHWEAALHNNLADVLHHTGQEEASMAQLKEAVTIYAEIGQEAGAWRPEIWKLTTW